MNQNDSLQTLTFRMPTSYVQKIDNLSETDKRARANLISKIVTDYIDEHT